MGHASITITDPFHQISERVDFGIWGISDFSNLFESLADDWIQTRREQFSSHGDGTWPDYLPSERNYTRFKNSKGAGSKVLVWDQGHHARRLYRSLTEPNHPDFVWRAGPTALTLGTKVRYASRHLTGGSTPRWGGVVYPIRNFLRLGRFDDLIGVKVSQLAAEVGGSIASPDKLDNLPFAGT